VVSLAKFIRQPAPEWFMVLGLVGMFVFGIIYMSLHVPFLSEVKASYAFPVLVPFSALAAVGWNWLGQKHRAVRTALWVILLVWVMTVYAAFWIRSGNPETCRVRGIYQMIRQTYAAAIESLSQALRLNPDDADAHCVLAEILSGQNQKGEAIRHYHEALRVRPDFLEALNNLAWLLATSEDAGIRDGAEAVRLAEHACELTHYQQTMMVGTLAAAYAEAGRFDDAMATAQKACALASESGQQALLNKNQELLELYRAHRAYHEPSDGPVPAAP
jgi:cytochrome c-type biogenesis protein CcmH/NrfG